MIDTLTIRDKKELDKTLREFYEVGRCFLDDNEEVSKKYIAEALNVDYWHDDDGNIIYAKPNKVKKALQYCYKIPYV